MLTRDPPDHTRLRGLAMRAFTPSRIAQLGDRIATITNQLLDEGLGRGALDVVGALARPLPTAVLAELLDVAPPDLPALSRWADDIFASVAGLAADRDRERVRASYAEFDTFFSAQIEARRRAPKDDLLSALVLAHDERAALTTTEISARTALYQQADRIMAQDYPHIPIYHDAIRSLVKPYLKGYVPARVLGLTPLRTMSVDPH